MYKNRRSATVVTATIFVLIFFFRTAEATPEVIELTQSVDGVWINNYSEWLADPSKSLTLEDVTKGSASSSFKPALNGNLHFGITNEVYWVKFRVSNKTKNKIDWILETDQPDTDLVKVFAPRPNGGFTVKTAGDLYHYFSYREIKSHKPTFNMSTPPGTESTIYLRFEWVPIGILNLSSAIYTPDEYLGAISFEYLCFGLFYGIMLVMFFYNLMIWISTREKAFLYYCGYLLVLTYFWLSMNGFMFQFFFQNSLAYNHHATAGGVGLLFIMASVFSREFLKTKELLPRADKVILFAMFLGFINIYFWASANIGLGLPYAYFTSLLLPMFLVIGAISLFNGYRSARFYVFSWAMFVAGAVIFSLKDLGVFPHNDFTKWSAQVGTGLEATFISFALADRIKILAAEKEVAEENVKKALERVKDELEESVAQRTSELRKEKDIAEKATELKDKFVSLVSHDLRGPIESIQKFTAQHTKDGKFTTEENITLVPERVTRISGGLLALIDELLDVSRMQGGVMAPIKTEIKTRALVENSIDNFFHLAKDKGIDILNELPYDTLLWADKSMMGEVIGNLISNAIKFSEKGGEIAISSPEPGVIAIKDSGVGMDAGFAENIFQNDIHTSTTGTTGEPGTGLGLPYCYDIMKAHDGEIRVETKKGEGAMFYLTLPEDGRSDA